MSDDNKPFANAEDFDHDTKKGDDLGVRTYEGDRCAEALGERRRSKIL